MTDEIQILKNERYRPSTKFNSLTPERLSSMLDKGARGEPEEWAEFCEHAIEPESELSNSIRTLKANVLSGPWTIDAGESPDKDPVAADVAKFVKSMIQKISNFPTVLNQMIDGILPGYSAHELIWARDDQLKANTISEMRWIHQRRFRWDEDWKLRLWDYGQRGDARWGEKLKANKWCIFTYLDKSSYPGHAGLMREICWPWLFIQWANKFWIHGVENYGSPRTIAKVPNGTPTNTMVEVKAMLDNLSYDSTAVFREATEIIQLSGPSQADDGAMYKIYIDKAEQKIAKIILGATDINEAGITGSRAAVETRVEKTLNPRVISLAQLIWACLREQVFKPLVRNNAHLFGGREDVAIPTGRFAYQDPPKYDEESSEITTDETIAAEDAKAITDIIAALRAGTLSPDGASTLLAATYPRLSADTIEKLISEPEKKEPPAALAPFATPAGKPTNGKGEKVEAPAEEPQNPAEIKPKNKTEPKIVASSDILPTYDRYDADPEWDTADWFVLNDTDRAITAKKIGKIKAFIQHSIKKTADILDDYRDEMADGIKELKSIDGLPVVWSRIGRKLRKDRTLVETIRTSIVTPFIAGKAMVAAHARKQFVMSAMFTMQDKSLFEMPWDEAINAYKAMPIFDEKGFDEFRGQAGKKAGSIIDDIVAYLRQRSKANIESTLKEGGTFADYAAAMLDENQTLGIEPSDPAYLNMVYRTNIATAYGAGRWDAQRDISDELPYWEYLTVGDGRVRDAHRILHGKIFKIGNPKTDRLVPPNDYNCRCISVSREDPGDKEVEKSDRRFEAAYGEGFAKNPLEYLL